MTTPRPPAAGPASAPGSGRRHDRPGWVDQLERWLGEHGDELVAVRRHLHAHPELGNQEHATTELIAERLVLVGLRPRILEGGTGLVCDIEPDRPGPGPDGGGGTVADDGGGRIALRADLDALPMDDLKDVAYRSQNPGVAHACGHDVHTTVLLGVGLFLARHRHLLGAPVRLLFQPAEEVIPGGALQLVRHGALDGVATVVGLHCEPKLPVGRIGLRTGAITSAADLLEIRLEGPGGHTARPHETVDLVRVAAEVVGRLPDLVHDAIRHHGTALVVFGAIHAGDAGNVIPTSCTIRGSVRTQSAEVWDRIGPVIEAAVAHIAGSHGARHHTSYQPGVPPVVNDGDVIARVEAAATQVLGPDAVARSPQSWGGDDFAYLTRQAPGAYIRLGVRGTEHGNRPLDLHVGHFDVDESAIGVGVRTLVGTVLVDGDRRS